MAWSTAIISIDFKATKIYTVSYKDKMVHLFNSAKILILIAENEKENTN